VTALSEHGDAVLAAMEELIRRARRRIDVVLAAQIPHTSQLHAALRQVLSQHDDGSLRVRVLCSAFNVDRRFIRDVRDAGFNVDVRVARMPMMDSVVADDSSAVMYADAVIGRRASVTDASDVIAAMGALFDDVWRKSVSLTGQINLGDPVRSDFARSVLSTLHAGLTDEAAARNLGISIRTYRRYVAEIMESLGARSRFQAGVNAIARGLMPSDNQAPAAEARV